MNKIFRILAVLLLVVLFGCEKDASIASRNLSKEADQFRVKRRVIFYNGITDTYMFEMIGNISIDTDPVRRELAITAKIGVTL